MCWTGKKKPRYRVAEEDITVYKTLSLDGKSPVYDYLYVCGVEQPKVKIKSYRSQGEYRIHEGYHSFVSERAAKAWWLYSGDTPIHLFKIPRGTRMSPIGTDGDVVSETIVRVE